jgi:3-methyladenine DNA glycosylase AlkD
VAPLFALKQELRKKGSLKKAKASSRFFKTGKGQYGEGDIFIGVTVPKQRIVAKKFKDLSLSDIQKLLQSKEHEFRLTALIILVGQFKVSDDKRKKEIYNFYLKNTTYINNWDLVDSSAHHIVGAYLDGKDKKTLTRLVKSKLLWERRIATLATFYYIQKGESKEAFATATLLSRDENDLIQKAVGWMLREVGKHCGRDTLLGYLDTHYKKMPRTTLRYAIEHFSKKDRSDYLQGKR